MRQVYLTDAFEHTPTHLLYKGARFAFAHVSERLSDLCLPLTYQDSCLLIFGANAQGAADFMLAKYHSGNLKIKAAELEGARLRDLCQDHFEYCRDMNDLNQIQLTEQTFQQVCSRRTIVKSGGVSAKLSRIYEIRRCCYNEECRQTHGSVKMLVVGEDDIPALKEFAGQHKGKLSQFFAGKPFDVCACISKGNIDQCMEILFMFG